MAHKYLQFSISDFQTLLVSPPPIQSPLPQHGASLHEGFIFLMSPNLRPEARTEVGGMWGVGEDRNAFLLALAGLFMGPL